MGAGLSLLLPSFAMAEVVFETYPYLLGDKTIAIKILRNGSGSNFVCPHDNENTASAIAAVMVRAHGGTLIELSHSGERNINFSHAGVAYTFDPNRMFTDRGIKATLQALGPYSEDAYALVKNFADVVKLYFKPGLIIAMHNNTNGAYSIRSYIAGGDMQTEASQVYVNPDIDPDNFFFVTTLNLFNRLKDRNFNVVLQASRTSDDGSLSVYAAQKGVPYVNIEAQAGKSAVQQAMVESLL